MYSIFRSETDSDLCRFWQGTIDGTWSVTGEEGERIVSCVTLAEALTAIAERHDLDLRDPALGALIESDDPLVADALADAPKEGDRVTFTMPFEYLCDGIEFTIGDGETGTVATVDSDGTVYVRLDDTLMNLGPQWGNEVAVDVVEFPGVIETTEPGPDWDAVLRAAVGADATEVGEWPTGGGCTCLGAVIVVDGVKMQVMLTDGDSNRPTAADPHVSLMVQDDSDAGYNEGRWVGADLIKPAQVADVVRLFGLHVRHESPSEDWLTPEALADLLKG